MSYSKKNESARHGKSTRTSTDSTAHPHGKKLFFVPMAGVEEIGLNFYAYGYQDKWLLVDFGMGFASDAKSYGLAGIDLIFPSPHFFAKQKDNIVGLVLTHAHEDHIGAIPHLWPELACPIYGSDFTIGIVREKLRETPFLRRVPLYPITSNEPLVLDPFTITPIAMTHSILEQHALLIEVGANKKTVDDETGGKELAVLHTGDWKIDPDPLLGAETDKAAFQALSGRDIAAVVSDSTNVFDPNPSHSEGEVRQDLVKVFHAIVAGRYKLNDHDPIGMIMVTCFASNLQRVFSIASAAEAIGRRVAVVGRAFQRYLKVARELGYLDEFPKVMHHLVAEKDLRRTPKNKLVVIATGSQGEWRGAFARIARAEHRALKPDRGDYMIFSSRVIPGNELAVAGIKNNLVKAGVRLMDVASETDDMLIHASGHPTRHDLKTLYEWIKPRAVIPVHGETRHLSEHLDFARKECGITAGIFPENGMVIEITTSHPPRAVGFVPTEFLAKDGLDIVPLTDKALTTRRKMGAQGAIVFTLQLMGLQVARHQLSVLGLALSTRQGQQLEESILYELHDLLKRDLLKRPEALETLLEKTIARYCRRHFDKTPVVRIHLLVSERNR